MATPERIAPGVYRVDAVRLSNLISVLLLEGSDGWTLVDTGLGNSAGPIREALAALGGNPDELRRIYLTHHHSDHIGSLPGLLEWAPEAEVMASEHEAEIISGSSEPHPSSNPVFRFISRYQRLPAVPVGKIVSEGDTVAGFRVIST